MWILFAPSSYTRLISLIIKFYLRWSIPSQNRSVLSRAVEKSPWKCRKYSANRQAGTFPLCCKKCAGRFPRHSAINKIISQAPSTARFPNILEPPVVSRIDNKPPDGLTIIPWERGKSLLWDATVI